MIFIFIVINTIICWRWASGVGDSSGDAHTVSRLNVSTWPHSYMRFQLFTNSPVQPQPARYDTLSAGNLNYYILGTPNAEYIGTCDDRNGFCKWLSECTFGGGNILSTTTSPRAPPSPDYTNAAYRALALTQTGTNSVQCDAHSQRQRAGERNGGKS